MLPRKHQGFTLLEILVALLVFVILGVIVAVGMNRVLRARAHLNTVQAKLAQTCTAMLLMQRDFSNLIDRPILDRHGDALPSFIAGGTDSIEFTRTGNTNPLFAEKRSDLLRVAYKTVGNKLERWTWTALDRPPHAKPNKAIILSGVSSIDFQFVNQYGQVVGSWVISNGMQNQLDQNQKMPKAVIVTLRMANGAALKRIYRIGGVGLGGSNV